MKYFEQPKLAFNFEETLSMLILFIGVGETQCIKSQLFVELSL